MVVGKITTGMAVPARANTMIHLLQVAPNHRVVAGMIIIGILISVIVFTRDKHVMSRPQVVEKNTTGITAVALVNIADTPDAMSRPQVVGMVGIGISTLVLVSLRQHVMHRLMDVAPVITGIMITVIAGRTMKQPSRLGDMMILLLQTMNILQKTLTD
jgi:hypothetical protein